MRQEQRKERERERKREREREMKWMVIDDLRLYGRVASFLAVVRDTALVDTIN